VPSLRAIWALATALEIPFGALLARTGAMASTFRVQRAAHGRVTASAGNRFRSRALSPVGDRRAPEVYELTPAPGWHEEAAPHARLTLEHLTVARGVLVVSAGNEVARLAPGDSLFFRADQRHSYENPTAEETVAHLVMTYA
jgi:quercetin dioxygenase-like cupin family protein